MSAKTKVLIVVGPTSSGKSALAAELARRFHGEIISADSRQVYRGLDIGTGKVTKREMRGVRHHLLDVASPRTVFTANDFVERARRAIEDIAARGKLPIVSGGTGFYIDSLLGRVILPAVPPNLKLRARLHTKSAAKLYRMLEQRDSARALSMDTPSERNNKVRLIRALEIAESRESAKHIDLRNCYESLWIGIAPPLQLLEKKIAARLAARMKKGMVAEAKRLHLAGLSYKRMHTLGLEYRALASLLQGRISRAEMATQLQSAIRKYAKRQIAYWKRNKEIAWFEAPNAPRIWKMVAKWDARRAM